MKSRLLTSSLIAIFALAAATTSSAAVNGPGPTSVKHHSKLDLSALLGNDKDTESSSPADATPGDGHSHADHGDDSSADVVFIAVISPTAGNEAAGTIYFQKVEGGMKVWGTIEGLTPGDHGFHVHQYGDVSAADGTSAGGHFNPQSQPHAGPDDAHRHVGDLGNITANENGVAEISFIDNELSMEGKNSILGRGLIVHADADDLTSQPTGAAGPRVGMAVIGVANPKDLQ